MCRKKERNDEDEEGEQDYEKVPRTVELLITAES